jgi:hypothetical protein
MHKEIINEYSVLNNEAFCLNQGLWKSYSSSLIRVNWNKNSSFLTKRVGGISNLKQLFYYKKNDKCKIEVDFVTRTPKGSLAISFVNSLVYYNLEAYLDHSVFQKKLSNFSKKMNVAKIEFLPDLNVYISPYYNGTLFQKILTKKKKKKALLKFIDSVLSCSSSLDEVKLKSFKSSYELAFSIVKKNNFFKINLSDKSINNIKYLLNSSKLIEGHGDLSVNNVIFLPDNEYITIDWFDAFQIIPNWFDATHILCTKGVDLLFDSLFFSHVNKSLSKELFVDKIAPIDLFIAWRIAWATNRSIISGNLDIALFKKNIHFALDAGIKKLKDYNICVA